jgi:hypothetical protein
LLAIQSVKKLLVVRIFILIVQFFKDFTNADINYNNPYLKEKTTTKNAIGKIIRIDEPKSAWLTLPKLS